MALRPVQALALHDIGTLGGLIGRIPVGGGKTLISLLAAYVLNAKRPLLLLPAALIQKTHRERQVLAEHWRIPTNIRLYSYEMLGRTQSANYLESCAPDLIIADEAHKLKNRKAACTKRVERHLENHPGVKFVPMSGTLIKDGLGDFAHLSKWSLKEGSPLPHGHEVQEWSDALDEKVNPFQRAQPGVLLEFATEEERRNFAPLQAARLGVKRRLLETPGVVSFEPSGVACSLQISAREYEVNDVTEANFQKLRTTWETPDGWAIADAIQLWRHARELALGFHYVWDPRPPSDWLAARSAWASFVREVLSRSHTLDSEKQVADAYANHELLRGWLSVKDTFVIQPKAIWHDDSVLEHCATWLHKEKGICWTEHTFFAEALAKKSGVSYFGRKGLDHKGLEIEKAKGPIIASVSANGTGRNLQYGWNKNLITTCPGGADRVEQLLGRTHREGQPKDEVVAEIMLGCSEHFGSMAKALAGARMTQDVTGQRQKLLYADLLWPSELIAKSPRFQSNKGLTAPADL